MEHLDEKLITRESIPGHLIQSLQDVLLLIHTRKRSLFITDALNLHSRVGCSLDESIRFITPIVSSVLNTKVRHTVLELETQRQILVAFCLHLFADPLF